MAIPRRAAAFGLAALALALTLFGVVVAATNSNPGAGAKDPLALNGYPPKSAEIALSLTTGNGATLNAKIDVNFTRQRVDAFVTFPLVVTTVALEARDVDGRVYVRSADDSTGPWLSAKYALPSLFGVSLELTKPDVDLVKGFKERVTKSGYQTTYHFGRADVAVGALGGLSSGDTKLGSVLVSVTTGAQGEAVAASVVVHSGTATTTLNARVLSYNQPAVIEQPPSSQVTPLKSSLVRKLLKSKDLTSALLPLNLFNLGQASVT